MLAVTLSMVVLLAYTYLGYPLLIAICARVSPLRVERRPGYTPRVSAILAAHNAAEYLRPKLDSLLAQEYPKEKLEIAVCSDGSDDETDSILAEYAAKDSRVKVVRSEVRRGKPSAVNRAREAATGEVLLMTDIRQPLGPESVRALVEALADPRIGCVSGNLILRGGSGVGLYWRYESWIRRSESAFRGMVGVTGSIYVIRAKDMKPLPPDIVLDDMWVPMQLRLGGQRIVLEPRAEAYDEAFDDRRELSRKIRTLAGNYQLFARCPRLLVPIANPSWFEMFSHKVLRLVAPWLMITLLASSSVAAAQAVPGSVSRWLLGGLVAAQLAFYIAAAAGRRAGRAAAIARTFIVLNYAAIAGLVRFVRGQRITW
jgi:cellulose synthase/poly-beta-1,6-N-acetylglucosamine synthase-like glycosyltransferase